jgi:serine/threonine protein kinase
LYHWDRARIGKTWDRKHPLQPSTDTGPQSGPFGRHDPSLPQVFGRYLLVQRLSRGGMGEIFLAKHGLTGFEKLAVIKKVLPHLAADEQFISRFVDEAQVAIKLQHVNVAQVFEVGRVGNEYFLALEYIEGRDLRRTLSLLGHRRERMPVDLALFIARELANGLAYAHRRTAADGTSLNLVHCDISPPNVLVSFEGETKVIDFGIAKSVMRATVTDPKLGFGKFGYMAPEQLIRGGVVDHRTDLYAAGVVLFELITATRLYEGGPQPDYRALARKVARGEHPLPSHIDPQLAPYDELVATALRPRPEDRYQSAAALRDAIQQCLVAVNPTISTDRLGAYMRELFAGEMLAQRELHERVASAHLADFQDQFHTQTIATVSFALAQLPLPPPEATGPVARRRVTGPSPVAPLRSTGSNPVAALRHPGPSPADDTMAPPTGAMEPVVLDDGATLVGGMSYARTIARRRRMRRHVLGGALAALGMVAVFGLVFGIWALVTRGGRPRAPTASPSPSPTGAPAAPPAVRSSGITVEPIQVAPAGAARGEPPEIDMTDDAPGPAGAAQPGPRTSRDAVHRPVRKEIKPPPAPAVAAAFTRDQLVQKFQQVSREYDVYKARFGSRLEREWGELATFITYMPASEDDAARREAARRLDEFRTRMRE